jgi:hypothetical protein
MLKTVAKRETSSKMSDNKNARRVLLCLKIDRQSSIPLARTMKMIVEIVLLKYIIVLLEKIGSG